MSLVDADLSTAAKSVDEVSWRVSICVVLRQVFVDYSWGLWPLWYWPPRSFPSLRGPIDPETNRSGLMARTASPHHEVVQPGFHHHP
jgi:hypothetical protein